MELKPISMTTFVDFAVASPGAKVTVARRARRLYEGYKWVQDPYRGLKEEFTKFVREGRHPATLRELLAVAPPNQEEHWSACIEGFIRILGRRSWQWDQPPGMQKWASGDLTVNCSPEVAPVLRAVPHVVKLYLKGPKLTKVRVNPMLELLLEAFPNAGQVGILDVRRAKLFTPPVPRSMPILLRGEAASFVEIWHALDGPEEVAS